MRLVDFLIAGLLGILIYNGWYWLGVIYEKVKRNRHK